MYRDTRNSLKLSAPVRAVYLRPQASAQGACGVMAEPDEQGQLNADEIRQLYHDPRLGLCGLKAFVQKLRGRATPAAIRKALDADEPFALNVPRTRRRSFVASLCAATSRTRGRATWS